MNRQAEPTPGDAVSAEPRLNIAPVEEMLRLFARAVRAHQMYMHNNPTYLRALEGVRTSFAAIWTLTDELVLDVSDTQLTWEEEVVSNEPDKTSDALPWILYKDGIRELRLTKGVELQEILTLVQLVARVRKSLPDEDDLLTLLWEQEFSHIRYRYIDLSFEGAEPLETSADAMRPRLVDSSQINEPPKESLLPEGVVNIDDFSTTLYFLDEREVEYLRSAIVGEYQTDLRGNVVSMLLDVFEQQVDGTIRDEICEILDNFLVSLLAAGQLRTVAFLLREVNIAVNRARDLSPAERDKVLSLPNRLSEPEALSQLLQSLDERVDQPVQADLNDLFQELRVGALGTIFAWLGRIQSPKLRQQLETAASRLAATNTAELVRLIASSDREVMLEAVKRSGAMRAQAAVGALARQLTHAEAPVRLAAVTALAEIATPGALQQMERMIDDPERDVRVATARAFAAKVHRPALVKLEGALKGKRMHDADLTEKMALFEAFGAMCGDGGISVLDGYLNSKGLFGRREDPELRACAAMALGRIGSDAAVGVLRKASSDKEILVRNAVNRALRGPGT